MSTPREHRIGPWLVAAGAALWGTENAFRIPLAKVFAPDVLVFWEHAILVLIALPFVIPRLGELRRASWKAIAWLIFSGAAGSAVGAVLFTLALSNGNPTVVSVVLNVQPILSTACACLFFGDRLAPLFYPWAALAVVAGAVLVGFAPGLSIPIDAGTGFALATALLWGLSTVAGRGAMMELSVPLASGMRVIIGLVCMAILVGAKGLANGASLWPDAAAADPGHTVLWLILLSTLSGAIPLAIYFWGLRLTRASTAGYFEMMQTISAVCVTWALGLGDPLSVPQLVAAAILVGAVAMVQRAQRATEK